MTDYSAHCPACKKKIVVRHVKQWVLEALADAGGYVSGEEISQKLNKSRTAVWQSIAALREDGYVIEAAPRRGYRLIQRPDRLFPWEVLPRLKTKRLGRLYEYRDSVDSTNNLVKALAKDGASEGLVAVAEEQTSGRGRRGRSWSSPYGLGLWMSVLLRPDMSPFDAPKTALMAALAVSRAVREATGLSTSVKWPNDVLTNGRKMSGILVEMDAELESVRSLIIGIGANVNLDLSHIPEDARNHATSLKLELGEKVDRIALLTGILHQLEIVYDTWREHGFDPILQAVRQETATLGKPVRVVEGSSKWEGLAVDIAADGSLLVQKSDGHIQPVYAGEVSVR